MSGIKDSKLEGYCEIIGEAIGEAIGDAIGEAIETVAELSSICISVVENFIFLPTWGLNVDFWSKSLFAGDVGEDSSPE